MIKERLASNSMNIHNILLATDFSPSSKAALKYAAFAAKRCNCHLFVVHVISESVYTDVPPEILAKAKTHTLADARRRLERLRSGLKDIQTEFILKEGLVADTLLALTESKSVDLVVLGTRGHRRIERLLLGSVAEKLSRQASCPVLVVPDSAVSYLSKVTINSILCPTNFSQRSTAALQQAMRFANDLSARVILLHVVEDSTLDRADRIASSTAVKQRLSSLSSSWSSGEPSQQAELVVEFGAPARTILRVAAERHIDLIVLSIQRAKPVAAHLPPEITYSVVQLSQCPVLTIAT